MGAKRVIRPYMRFAAILWGFAVIAGSAFSQTPQINPAKDIGLDQRLSVQAPLDLQFTDETGKSVRLRDYFGKRPVILNLIFYKCPMACTLELDGMSECFTKMPLAMGEDYQVVTVSINPKEGPEIAAQKKRAYIERYRLKGGESGWHMLVGEQTQIKALAAPIGYRYFADLKKQQFAHPSGIIILTPEGKISRYFFGTLYSAKDVRVSLLEASHYQIGSLVDRLVIGTMMKTCLYGFDPTTGKYGIIVMNLIKAGGLVTILSLATFMFVSIRREKRERNRHLTAGPKPAGA